MKAKLSTANQYLRDPAIRDRTVLKSVASSSAIEGIRSPFKQITSNSGSVLATKRLTPKKR